MSFGVRLAIAAVALTATAVLAATLLVVRPAVEVHERAVAAGTRTADGSAALRGVLVRGLVGGVGAVGLGAAGWALWVGRRHERDVRSLDAVARRLRAGDLEVPVLAPASGELKRLAADLDQLGAALRGMRRTRAEFVATVAHDLRAPLQVVHLAAERLERRAADVPEAEAARAIVRECRALAALADDLLVLGESDAVELVVDRGRVDLPRLLEEVRARAEATNPEVVVRVRCAVAEIEGDARRLGQLLTNLAVNAARHTPTGGSVLLEARRVEGGAVELIVEDDGPGIDPALAAIVMEPFRGDRVEGGAAGLGLTIARRLVTAHGGLLRLVPRPEGGTRAIASLPGVGA